jgi:bifunctional UDP-N-acetylglucosamine pyrophosphorylase/glucosamine-1-phosphate N-acetyltransferase
MLENIQAIILAGGISERFHTGKTKLIEKICGTELILYPIRLLKNLEIPTTVVIGYQYELIKNIIQKKDLSCNFILQNEPLGTGHALQITQNIWSRDHVLVMHGDIPLLTADVINKLYRKHTKFDADISFITAHVDNTHNKESRVIINNNKIELSDETNTEIDPSHCCISAGVYLIKRSFLEQNINSLTKDEATGESFLQELVQIASEQQAKIVTQQVGFDLIRSVETLADLWAIEHICRSKILQYWMDHGVRFANTLNIIIEETVKIEPGSFIDTGVILTGSTNIKKGSQIGAYTQIKDSIIEDNTTIPSHMIISNATITKYTTLQSFTEYQGNTQQQTGTIFIGSQKLDNEMIG